MGRARYLCTLLVLLAGCAAQPPHHGAASYVVQGGDTLHSIGVRVGIDYHDLARWNGIGDDYRISIGQVLRLAPPGTPAGASIAARTPKGASGKSGAPTAAAPATGAGAARPLPPPPVWTWPADGRAAGTITQPAGGVGLRIDGEIGMPVRAAAAGRVVYRGTGLRSYGTLIIIKHDDTWLTAYGYNASVLVTEGAQVLAGQQIGTMGEGPERRAMLYFEIRANGRPVDPSGQLPPRR
jgi:lipoprotein NlpD